MQLPDIARSLLAWWDRSRSELPWRTHRSPYSVWVSEVMLQQTGVSVVIPYYQRWMQKYPDTAALARAEEQEVLRFWEGLGYYSRARNLLRAARFVQHRWNGMLPASYGELRRLPGVGDYTARAILSIAFGLPYAAADANARRVVQRLCAQSDPPSQHALQTGLEAVMPPSRPGDFNEALMELGQRVCTKSRPRCGLCPLARACRARACGAQDRIPRPRRLQATARASLVAILLHDHSVYLCAHPRGLFRGLWTFPRLPVADPRAPRQTASDLSLRPRIHTYTRYRERLLPQVFPMAERQETPFDMQGLWIPLEALEAYPMPSAHRRIARELLAWLLPGARIALRRPRSPAADPSAPDTR